MSRRKRLGVESRCSFLVKRLHLGNITSKLFPNASANKQLEDCVIMPQKAASCNGNNFIGTFLSHPLFNGNEDIYIAKRFCIIWQEGNPSGFFDFMNPENTMVQSNPEDEDCEKIDATVVHAGNRAEDITVIRNQGIVVDDNNEPALENVGAQPDANNLYPMQTWGVQIYVDQMELHGSKKSAGFLGDFQVNIP